MRLVSSTSCRVLRTKFVAARARVVFVLKRTTEFAGSSVLHETTVRPN
jgi:hypothetical protein